MRDPEREDEVLSAEITRVYNKSNSSKNNFREAWKSMHSFWANVEKLGTLLSCGGWKIVAFSQTNERASRRKWKYHVFGYTVRLHCVIRLHPFSTKREIWSFCPLYIIQFFLKDGTMSQAKLDWDLDGSRWPYSSLWSRITIETNFTLIVCCHPFGCSTNGSMLAWERRIRLLKCIVQSSGPSWP